jgi:hypothetical protein
MMTRKPNNQPATAWEYRRAIELCQVLAIQDALHRWEALYALCQAWGLPTRGKPAQIATRLAQHALKGADAGD